MPEILCNKVADLEPASLFIYIKSSAQVFTGEFCETFQKACLARSYFCKCFFYITLLNDCFYISEDLTFMR